MCPCHTDCFRRYRCTGVSTAGPCSTTHETPPDLQQLHQRSRASPGRCPGTLKRMQRLFPEESDLRRFRDRRESSTTYQTCASNRPCLWSSPSLCHTAQPLLIQVSCLLPGRDRVHDNL